MDGDYYHSVIEAFVIRPMLQQYDISVIKNFMKTNNKSISLLNKAVGDELSAIHQYMYFHFHCDDQGFDLLASLFKKTAIDEMKHLERLAERILFLEGDVDMQIAKPVQKTKSVKEMLKLAAEMEREGAKEYNEWANVCAANADAATRQLFESLVTEEEGHFDKFDTELRNISKFGENYLTLQSIERSKSNSK
jgi:bacterioferritin